MGLLDWIENFPVSIWVAQAPTLLAYPGIITLHTIGMAMTVGPNAVVDLRILGVGSRVPLSALRGMFRVMVYGFTLNAVTGVLLFMAAASHTGVQQVFYVKLVLIALALVVAARTKTTLYGRGELAQSVPRKHARWPASYRRRKYGASL
mgnify:CR=1 FL=1